MIRRLERRQVDEAFLDVIVATRRMLAVEAVTSEAMRMILTALRESPEATSHAVLAGVAARHIAR